MPSAWASFVKGQIEYKFNQELACEVLLEAYNLEKLKRNLDSILCISYSDFTMKNIKSKVSVEFLKNNGFELNEYDEGSFWENIDGDEILQTPEDLSWFKYADNTDVWNLTEDQFILAVND